MEEKLNRLFEEMKEFKQDFKEYISSDLKDKKEMKKDFQDFKLSASVQIGKLVVKSGFYGLLGGAIVPIGGLLIWLFRSKM